MGSKIQNYKVPHEQVNEENEELDNAHNALLASIIPYGLRSSITL